ncbi:MAG: hypothetical protein ACOYKZ_00235 [Chlamydiia bacterium]
MGSQLLHDYAMEATGLSLTPHLSEEDSDSPSPLCPVDMEDGPSAASTTVDRVLDSILMLEERADGASDRELEALVCQTTREIFGPSGSQPSQIQSCLRASLASSVHHRRRTVRELLNTGNEASFYKLWAAVPKMERSKVLQCMLPGISLADAAIQPAICFTYLADADHSTSTQFMTTLVNREDVEQWILALEKGCGGNSWQESRLASMLTTLNPQERAAIFRHLNPSHLFSQRLGAALVHHCFRWLMPCCRLRCVPSPGSEASNPSSPSGSKRTQRVRISGDGTSTPSRSKALWMQSLDGAWALAVAGDDPVAQATALEDAKKESERVQQETATRLAKAAALDEMVRPSTYQAWRALRSLDLPLPDGIASILEILDEPRMAMQMKLEERLASVASLKRHDSLVSEIHQGVCSNLLALYPLDLRCAVIDRLQKMEIGGLASLQHELACLHLEWVLSPTTWDPSAELLTQLKEEQANGAKYLETFLALPAPTRDIASQPFYQAIFSRLSGNPVEDQHLLAPLCLCLLHLLKDALPPCLLTAEFLKFLKSYAKPDEDSSATLVRLCASQFNQLAAVHLTTADSLDYFGRLWNLLIIHQEGIHVLQNSFVHLKALNTAWRGWMNQQPSDLKTRLEIMYKLLEHTHGLFLPGIDHDLVMRNTLQYLLSELPLERCGLWLPLIVGVYLRNELQKLPVLSRYQEPLLSMALLFQLVQGPGDHTPDRVTANAATLCGEDSAILTAFDSLGLLDQIQPPNGKVGRLIQLAPNRTRLTNWILSEVTSHLKWLPETCAPTLLQQSLAFCLADPLFRIAYQRTLLLHEPLDCPYQVPQELEVGWRALPAPSDSPEINSHSRSLSLSNGTHLFYEWVSTLTFPGIIGRPTT